MKHDWSVEDYDEYRKNLVNSCQRVRRERAKANGLCSICCIRPARKNKKTCQVCSDRANRYGKEHYRKGSKDETISPN